MTPDIVVRVIAWSTWLDERCPDTDVGNDLREATDEIARLRAERDEARRRLCLEWEEHGPVRLNKEQIAMRYGWDCFKEEQ